MSYFFEKKLKMNFETALERVKSSLKVENFGIVSEMDMSKNLKHALGKEMKPYIVLGACSPEHAWEAVSKEPNIGVLLPCNVVVAEISSELIRVSVVNPMVAMSSVGNPALAKMATEVTEKLIAVIDRL